METRGGSHTGSRTVGSLPAAGVLPERVPGRLEHASPLKGSSLPFKVDANPLPLPCHPHCEPPSLMPSAAVEPLAAFCACQLCRPSVSLLGSLLYFCLFRAQHRPGGGVIACRLQPASPNNPSLLSGSQLQSRLPPRELGSHTVEQPSLGLSWTGVRPLTAAQASFSAPERDRLWDAPGDPGSLDGEPGRLLLRLAGAPRQASPVLPFPSVLPQYPPV